MSSTTEEQTITTADGCTVREGDRVWCYYATPQQWGTVATVDRWSSNEPGGSWADVDHDDGTHGYYNGERLACVDVVGGTPDPRRCGVSAGVFSPDNDEPIVCTRPAGHEGAHVDTVGDRPSIVEFADEAGETVVPTEPVIEATRELFKGRTKVVVRVDGEIVKTLGGSRVERCGFVEAHVIVATGDVRISGLRSRPPTEREVSRIRHAGIDFEVEPYRVAVVTIADVRSDFLRSIGGGR